jgi:hypothetical protein
LSSAQPPHCTTLLARLRDVVGDRFLVGEVGLPTASLEPYLDHLDAAFAFEVFHGAWDSVTLRRGIELTMQMRGQRGRLASLTSNHDYPRLASRVGADDEPVAAMLLLTLPGSVFIYQGDEIGQRDGRGDQPPLDRAGRDAFRHPRNGAAPITQGSPPAVLGCPASTLKHATSPTSSTTPGCCCGYIARSLACADASTPSWTSSTANLTCLLTSGANTPSHSTSATTPSRRRGPAR